MALFGFGRKKPAAATDDQRPVAERNASVAVCAAALAELLENRLNEPGRGIRVEDLLSAAAAVTGQACIRTASDYDPDSHDFIPGAAVFSERANVLLVGDTANWEAAPGDCVFAVVRTFALAHGYAPADFPPIDQLIGVYAAGLGGDAAQAIAQYGRVPLSAPPDNRPRRPPLQDAWDLRLPVAALFEERGTPAADRLAACALALGIVLTHVKDAIDHGLAVRLTLETVNGMAKMAPMTPKHWAEAASTA
jgi:hypothetical protein